MALRSMEDERADASDAFQKASGYHAELREIYKFYQPYRMPVTSRSDAGQGNEGATRTDHLFDGTGLSAAFNFAGMMVADWLPPFSDFFKLEAGPLVAQENVPQLNAQLQNITRVVHGVLPKVRLTAHEMFADLFCGTGAMYLGAGNERDLVRGQVAPIVEIALEDGPFGDVWGIWWKRKYKARHLEATWPNGRWSTSIRDQIRNRRTTDVVVIQSTRYDPADDEWVLRVYVEGDERDHEVWSEKFRTCPWQTPRFFKVPGESFGRGLAHLGLPFVKTANKTRELALRAAAFALMGIWMRRNDGVFNPDTAVFKPLAMWTVGSTGGPLGPTLQRLPIPQDFDVASIVLKDERDQINRVLLNDDLPELQDSVRSPTEIAARLRRATKHKGGAGARISQELVTALVQRTIEILERQGKLGSSLTLDQMFAKVTITAPAAAAQRADRVQWAVDWMQMVLGLVGMEGMSVLVKVEELLPEIGRWMGNDERFIRSSSEQNEFRDVIAHIVAAQQKQAAAPKPPSPQSQFVNGAVM